MIRPATRGPDPVRDREGIDIGFLDDDCRGRGQPVSSAGSSGPGTRATRRGGAGRAHHTGRSRIWGADCRSVTPAGCHIPVEARESGRECGRESRSRSRSAPRGRASRPARPAFRRSASASSRRPRAGRSSPTAAQVPAVPPRPPPACCSAGRAIRSSGCRRSSRCVLWLDAASAGEPRAPREPGAARRGPGLVGARAARGPVRAGLRHRALRHHAVLGPHGPAHAADPGGAGPAAVRGADHAPAARLLRGDPRGAGSSRSCTRGSCGSSRSRWWPGCCSRPSCGGATSRRCSTRPSRTSGSTAWSTRLFLGAALLFWWPVVGPDPSPWRMKPAAKVLYVGLQMPQNTFLALRDLHVHDPALPALRDDRPQPGARRRSRTSRWPAASCGWAATSCSWRW